MYDGVKPQKLHGAIDAFLNERKGKGGYENACTHMKHWKRLPDKLMKEIKLHEVQAVVAQRRDEGAAHNTLAVFVGYWNALQNFCQQQGWTSAPKLPGMKAERTKLRVLTKEEEQRLFQAIDPEAMYAGKNPIQTQQRIDNRDLLVCLLSLGARLNEIQKMHWSQVDFNRGVVHVKRLKGGIDSSLVMTPRLREVLERRYQQYKETGWVFPTKADHKTNTAWIRDAVKRAGIDESIGKITLHTTRHTSATRLLAGGMSVVETQKILGHKNIASTLVYAHVQEEAAAIKAAEILGGK